MSDLNRVLLIEDDRTSAYSYVERLLDNGFEVTYAENAEKAKLLLLTETFDIAVIDLMMPPTFSMEGLELYKYIKGKGLNTSVVLTTARDNGTIEIVAEAMKLGATDFLDKHNPLFLDKLVLALKEISIARAASIAKHERNGEVNSIASDTRLDVFSQSTISASVGQENDSFKLDPKHLTPNSVFVSYSRANWKNFVEPLINGMVTVGIPVWVDQHLIRGGDDWLEEINRALKVCNRMILCVSPDSLSSRYVKIEYRYFFNNGKQIYPLICQVAELPAELQSIQYFAYDQQDQLLQTLLQTSD